MKRNIYLLFITLLAFSACDFLGAPEPKSSIPLTSEITSLDGYTTVLYGAYDGLQLNAAQLIDVNDIMGEDVEWHGSFPEYTQFANHDMNAFNFAIGDMWNRAYRSINIANIVINQAVGTIENAAQADIDNVIAQAHFIRAINYYYLVQYFAKPWGATADNSHPGVPIQLEAITDATMFVNMGRSSVKDVYDQIENDLIAASGKINNTNPFFASNNAVIALQARIALIQERWGDAADLAGDIIPEYTLARNVTDYFRNEGNSESIFEIDNVQGDVPGGGNYALTAVYNILSRNEGRISNAYRDALSAIITPDQAAAVSGAGFTASDTRVTELLTYPGNNVPTSLSGYTITSKYEDYVSLADNAPVFRLSEMILTRAEAITERDNAVTQEAIDLLNQIRSRAIKVTDALGNEADQTLIEYKVADFASPQELIDAILLERRVELSFEGHRRTDLQRRRMNVKNTAWDSGKLVLPIPDSQLNSEPLIDPTN